MGEFPVDTSGGRVGAGPIRTASKRRWIAPLVIIAIAMLSLWPALLNGGPFYHPDTPSYFRAAASGAYKAFGFKTAWAEDFFRVYQASNAATGGSASTLQTVRPEIPATLSGRSIYYGMFLYLSYLGGNVWIAVVVQCLVAATSVYLTLGLIGRAIGVTMHPAYTLLIGVSAALATPLGYVSGQLMPGTFTGIGLLAEANLLFLWSWQSRSERAFWIMVLAYAALVHNANLMLAATLLLVAFGYSRWRKLRIEIAQLSSVAGCIAVGLLGQAIFSLAVKATTGAPPVRPPFVAMRLIEDGPGFAYLQDHCAREPYIYCRVLRHTQRDSDDLLWSQDPRVSLFRGLTPDEQRLSASQQRGFVIAVIAERPVEVIADAARNSWVQLLSLDLVNFNYSTGNRERLQESIPQPLLASIKGTRAYRDQMPISFAEISTALLSVLSALFLVLFLGRTRQVHRAQYMRAYCLGILATIAINAVICGALSGPKGRYETRLIWILPIVAAAVASDSGILMRAAQRRGAPST